MKNDPERLSQNLTAGAVRRRGSGAEDNWRNIRLIVAREFRNQTGHTSFRIATVILLVAVVLGGFLPTIVQYIQEKTAASTTMVVINTAGAVAGLDEAKLDSLISATLNGASSGPVPPYAVTDLPPSAETDQENLVNDSQLGILLVISRSADQTLAFTYYTRSSLATDTNYDKILALANQLTFLDSASRLGLTSAQISSLLVSPNVTAVRTLQLQGNQSSDQLAAEYILAIAGVALMFMSVTLYCTNIANGVAEEKTNRVMELLINAATPFQLMFGKIIGIGSAGLLQMTLLVLFGIGAVLLQIPVQTALFSAGPSSFVHYLTSVSVPFYLLFFVYFLLYYFLFAGMYAGLGALVRQQNEVQSATQIPMILVFTTWLLMYVGITIPDSTAVIVLSYIPIYSPTMMLIRYALGEVAWWEVAITIPLMLASIAAVSWIAIRLYRYGILSYGQRPSLRRMIQIILRG